MPLSHEEIVDIKKEVIEECKTIFVQIDDCNDRQVEINKKLANDDKRIELLIHQQKINNWLTGAIASGIVALLIKVFIGG